MSGPRVPWQLEWLGLVLVWGASFLFMKVGLHALVPLQISTLRVMAGCAVLLLLLRRSGARLPRGWRAWAHLQVVAFFLATAPFTLFALGETRVSSALAGIGNAVTPVATVLLTILVVRDEHFSRPRLVGVLLGFLGVVVILQPWTVAERPDLLGFGLTLAAGTCYAIGWTWHRLHLARLDPGGLSIPTGQLVSASGQLLVLLLGWWALGGVSAPWAVRAGTAHGSVLGSIAAVLVLGALGTGWAFAAQFDVVRAAGATVATSVTYLIPVVSVLLGVLLLGERVGPWTVAGFALVLAGALLIGLGNRWSAALADRRAR